MQKSPAVDLWCPKRRSLQQMPLPQTSLIDDVTERTSAIFIGLW